MYLGAREESLGSCVTRCAERLWYAAYTRPQHERSVAEQATAKDLEVLLPVANVQRHWKQRVVHLPMPLFPGYVFVRMQFDERVQVLSIPSVVRLVSFNGKPATISDQEIDAIRTCQSNACEMRAHPYIGIGDRVRIKRGALVGIEGVVMEQGSMQQLVISVRLLQLAFSINVQPDDLEAVTRN